MNLIDVRFAEAVAAFALVPMVVWYAIETFVAWRDR